MSDGCTDCGRKGGCDHRKRGMFEAIDKALARLYPTRCWQHRQDDCQAGADSLAALTGPLAANLLGPPLAQRLTARMGTMALHVPGEAQEYCDYVYMLCLGRTPSLLEVREGKADPRVALEEAADPAGVSELYLRVALSTLAPFAAVQQVTVRGTVDADMVIIEEAPRTGVFDPLLLPRFKTLVAVLSELDLDHLDFGDLTSPPPGYEPGDYQARYGGEPTVANYLFYPQPASSITTTAVVLSHRGVIE